MVTICSVFVDIHWMWFVLSVCAVRTLLYIFSLVGSRAQATLHRVNMHGVRVVYMYEEGAFYCRAQRPGLFVQGARRNERPLCLPTL